MNPTITITYHERGEGAAIAGPSEDYEATFEGLSGRDVYGSFTLRHNFCEGVTVRVELDAVTRASLSLEPDEIDLFIAALTECKRRLALADEEHDEMWRSIEARK